MGVNEKCIQNFNWEKKCKRRDYFRNLDFSGKILLECNLNTYTKNAYWCGLNSTGLA